MKQHKTLILIILIALLARLLFFFFGAEIFYGKEDFYINGDTYSFVKPAQNLLETGTYTLDVKVPEAAFARLPGYSFVLLPFYLLFGDTTVFYLAVCLFQVLLDCLSVYLIFSISSVLSSDKSVAVVSGLLYALYPFVIVWTPVVYAETTGIFLMILIVYLLVKKKPPLLIGAILAFAFFVRPQLLFLLPAILLANFITNREGFIKNTTLFILGFCLVYLPWPLRNYINHDTIVPMRDISSMRSWQNDVLYFHKYMNALQAGWEPQMTQLISGDEVKLPERAITSDEDQKLLEKALQNSVNCSDGFASFMNRPPLEENCTEETAGAWRELYLNQMKNRPLNYFVVVPFKGLMKGLFKFQLISNWKSPDRSKIVMILTSGIFLLRTILILLGLFAIFSFIRKGGVSYVDWLALFYFLIWYGWLCIVTRYLEIRYFLPADVLLLLPAGRFLGLKMRFWNDTRQA